MGGPFCGSDRSTVMVEAPTPRTGLPAGTRRELDDRTNNFDTAFKALRAHQGPTDDMTFPGHTP